MCCMPVQNNCSQSVPAGCIEYSFLCLFCSFRSCWCLLYVECIECQVDFLGMNFEFTSYCIPYFHSSPMCLQNASYNLVNTQMLGSSPFSSWWQSYVNILQYGTVSILTQTPRISFDRCTNPKCHHHYTIPIKYCDPHFTL